jgi:hypothetical protein
MTLGRLSGPEAGAGPAAAEAVVDSDSHCDPFAASGLESDPSQELVSWCPTTLPVRLIESWTVTPGPGCVTHWPGH